MKPGPSNGSASIRKPLKKSSKSKSKTSKSSTSSQQQQTNPPPVYREPTAVPATQGAKDKSHRRSYAGFGAKTVKVFWEQHDTTDTEVSPEVYSRLAEDASYKVWELVNTAKTFARHSGGAVTCGLVNEVLKDMNVPPVLGANSTDWERIDYDGSFFFHSDEILELRDEYLKDINMESINSLELNATWMVDRRLAKHLIELCSNLCNAIFLGDEDAFNYALNTAAFSPQVGCILKLILKKTIEILAFEQKPNTIMRCLKLLQAIAINSHSRDVDCREQLFHLSELLVCLLLDTYESIKPPKLERKEESFEMVKNFLENSDPEIKKDETFNQMDVDDIRSEYEALFQVMERDGFQERDPVDTVEVVDTVIPEADQQLNEEILAKEEISDTTVVTTIATTTATTDITTTTTTDTTTTTTISDELSEIPQQNQEPQAPQSQQEQEESVELQDSIEIPVKLDFSPFKTEMCQIENVPPLCHTLGLLGITFGYMQKELTFLIVRRLKRFFDRKTTLTDDDYKYISRSVRGLIALGECSFREIIPFLYQIDSLNAPEWIQNHLHPAGTFLHGRDDIFLYEWMEDLCGDKLQPFLIYFYKYSQKRATKIHKRRKPASFTIDPKVCIKVMDKRSTQQAGKISEIFPEYSSCLTPKKKIGFRFAGCCPVIPKSKPDRNVVQQSLVNFNSKTVIARRRLFKPLTDKKKSVCLNNYCFLWL